MLCFIFILNFFFSRFSLAALHMSTYIHIYIYSTIMYKIRKSNFYTHLTCNSFLFKKSFTLLSTYIYNFRYLFIRSIYIYPPILLQIRVGYIGTYGYTWYYEKERIKVPVLIIYIYSSSQIIYLIL